MSTPQIVILILTILGILLAGMFYILAKPCIAYGHTYATRFKDDKFVDECVDCGKIKDKNIKG